MFWVEVLNQALDWQGAHPDRGELGKLVEVTRVDDSLLADLQHEIRLLRWDFVRRSLGLDLPRAVESELSQWLAAVTVTWERNWFEGPAGLDLRARRASGWPEPFESLLSTALVQLACLGSGVPLRGAVQRCQGVLRRTSESEGSQWPRDDLFARRAGLWDLVQAHGYLQCPRILVSSRGGRFCSKTCSNASFAARKASQEPRYFAEKQLRYRTKQQNAPSRPRDRGAFVYMD